MCISLVSVVQLYYNARCKKHKINQITKQGRQSTYNVMLGRVRATIGAVEKQLVLRNLSVCICSLRYPACNMHAP
jgi:hypothetical protein